MPWANESHRWYPPRERNSSQFRPAPYPAPVVRALLIANLIAFGCELGFGAAFVQPLELWPLGAGFAPWQLVTSAFLHGGFAHIAANLWGLWMFGRDVERVLGARRFLQLYTASVIAAGATQLLVTSTMHEHVPTLGASGGVFGVLLAFAMLFPDRTILLLLPPIPLPAWLFVSLYAAIELFSGIYGTESGIAHFAHLGGLAAALLLMRSWRRGGESGRESGRESGGT
jgi:membrane associated rhomboid family serine protease